MCVCTSESESRQSLKFDHQNRQPPVTFPNLFKMFGIDGDGDRDGHPHACTQTSHPTQILGCIFPKLETETKPKPTYHYKHVTSRVVWDPDEDEDGNACVDAPTPDVSHGGTVSNGIISVTPASLQFPHDDPREHVKRITVWNRTTNFVSFRIDHVPNSKYFKVFCDQTGIYGGAEADIIVKCRPGGERMYVDQLTLHITNMDADNLSIPVEIVPSISWFDKFDGYELWSHVTMPDAVLGKSVKYNFPFPTPPDAVPPYSFYVTGDKNAEVEISPTKGTIGQDMDNKLTVTYSPKTYTSIAYKITVHFPELAVRPFTLTVSMRCVPGLERALIEEQLQKELNDKQWELWRLNRAEVNAKLWKSHDRDVCTAGSKKHLRPIEAPPEPDASGKFDLCTPAGIQKFLIQPPGKVAWPQEELGPLGLTLYEMERIYKQKEKEFHDKYVRLGIQQRNLVTQPTKVVMGEKLIEAQPDKLADMIREKELHMFEYQKALGMLDNIPEDMMRKSLKLTRQQVLRDVGVNYRELLAAGREGDTRTKSVSESVWQEVDDDRSAVRAFILRPFIQAALLIITRKRADKRIAKLKLLVEETIQARQRLASSRGRDGTGVDLSMDEVPGEADGFRTSAAKHLRTRRKSTKQPQQKSIGNFGELTGEGPKPSKGRKERRRSKEKQKHKEKDKSNASMKPATQIQDRVMTGQSQQSQTFAPMNLLTPTGTAEAARTIPSNLGFNQDILPAPPPPPPSPLTLTQHHSKPKSKKGSTASRAKSAKGQRKGKNTAKIQ